MKNQFAEIIEETLSQVACSGEDWRIVKSSGVISNGWRTGTVYTTSMEIITWWTCQINWLDSMENVQNFNESIRFLAHAEWILTLFGPFACHQPTQNLQHPRSNTSKYKISKNAIKWRVNPFNNTAVTLCVLFLYIYCCVASSHVFL